MADDGKPKKRKSKISLPNTINRAAVLIRDGHVIRELGDIVRCKSQTTEGKIYFLDEDKCECWQGENMHWLICKHRWAAFAEDAVRLLSDIYAATTVEELIENTEANVAAGIEAPENFLKIARGEYKRRLFELKKAEAA